MRVGIKDVQRHAHGGFSYGGFTIKWSLYSRRGQCYEVQAYVITPSFHNWL